MKKSLAILSIILVAALLFVMGCSSQTGAGNATNENTQEGATTDSTNTTDEPEAQESNKLSEIQAAGVLKVGIEGTYSPYTYHDESDNLVGYDVEIAQAVAEKLGVTAEFTETKWDSLIAGLDVNHYDIVFNNVAVTDERKERYDFSTTYTYAHSTLIVRSDYDEINSFSDLAGKKSAQSITSNYAIEVESHGAEIVGTAGFAESIELVLNGAADVTVNDDLTYFDYMKQHPDAPLKIIDERGETIEIGAIFRKDNPEFKEAIDQALAELKEEGVLAEISIKYFGSDVSNG